MSTAQAMQVSPEVNAAAAFQNETYAGIGDDIDDISEPRWFALWTRSRQEKISAAMLDALGVANFLPLRTEARQWSDRKQNVSVPLFSGYLFVHMNLLRDNKLRVLKIPGIAGFVGNSTGPLPIPDHQVEAVRTVLTQGLECTVHPLLEAGDRVRVTRGALTGVEGTLLRFNSSTRLVISIEMIQRSLAVGIARSDVELMN
jgi:transcriptional antiterminator NusG